jgi:hypothetical protein
LKDCFLEMKKCRVVSGGGFVCAPTDVVEGCTLLDVMNRASEAVCGHTSVVCTPTGCPLTTSTRCLPYARGTKALPDVTGVVPCDGVTGGLTSCDLIRDTTCSTGNRVRCHLRGLWKCGCRCQDPSVLSGPTGSA